MVESKTSLEEDVYINLKDNQFIEMMSLVEEVTALVGELGYVSHMDFSSDDTDEDQDNALLVNFDISDPENDEDVAYIQMDQDAKGSIVFFDTGKGQARHRTVYYALAGLSIHFGLGFHIADISDDDLGSENDEDEILTEEP